MVLELECVAKEEAREKGTTGEGKKNPPPRNSTVKRLADAFPDFNVLLHMLENVDPKTRRFSRREECYLPISKSVRKERRKPGKAPWAYS